MKKLIGIVLTVCMLFSVVAAANTITQSGEASLNDDARTVTVAFVGLPDTAQATLLAYEVTGEMIKAAQDAAVAAGEDPDKAIPDFVDNTTTPIKGIDQASVSSIKTGEGETQVSSFTFKVAADYVGKMAVKVGGTDADPIAMLVEFADAGSGEEETKQVIFVFGDVNKDGKADGTDANLIVGFAGGASGAVGGAYEIGETVPVINVLFGDVNKDGKADGTDANLIVGFAGGASGAVGGAYEIGETVIVNVPVTD